MGIYWTKSPDGDRYEPTLTAPDGWKLVATWVGCSLVEIAFVIWVLS